MAKLEAGVMLQHTSSARRLKPPFDETSQVLRSKTVCVPTSELDTERERLHQSLQAKDLEKIHKQLWYAGRRGNISPLHHQRVLRREIVLTENPRLHLIWSKHILYIQPLPDELLDRTYFEVVICESPELYQTATGFLLSYTSLIRYPSDLEIAKACGLINKKAKWRTWHKFRSSVLENLQGRDIHDRFEYGELRLGRLNTIFRLRLLALSYFSPYRDYGTYFEHHYAALIALFALVSVALSAMQVVSGMKDVPAAITVTAYRFSIASLVSLAVSCTVLFIIYLGLYLWNWLLIIVRHR